MDRFRPGWLTPSRKAAATSRGVAAPASSIFDVFLIGRFPTQLCFSRKTSWRGGKYVAGTRIFGHLGRAVSQPVSPFNRYNRLQETIRICFTIYCGANSRNRNLSLPRRDTGRAYPALSAGIPREPTIRRLLAQFRPAWQRSLRWTMPSRRSIGGWDALGAGSLGTCRAAPCQQE